MSPYAAAQFQLCLARAAWWTAYAHTSDNKAKTVQRVDANSPTGWRDMTPDELVDRALAIANNHLTNAQAILDNPEP